ncbi:hypothetical protein BX616_002610 [Lobosporangium transversale]|uniref:Acyl-CoA N-acyltransferase n=1 Tax=Lobosporangium transversale TaxID=64571 RepID=A0A1Y2G9V2_9FUNG|nr:acyl-CoA N-acyltransferase [Lobosporangium transversale]KAF9900365.1 hypothetical protein BX616_002610 [Lobosporangium transversale]ORZ04963.1 acyl-CoA N-acyltransferase [Lobosporangium transversale]|eukprot:XP_021876827.1 acyl-CoA N-acyltransferase [Lobosporangium transversale]
MAARIRNFEKGDQEVVRHLLLEGLAERWGSAFDASYNQDVNDIDGYYIQYHHATVIVLEIEEGGKAVVVACGILLPLPAEDVYGTWCAEPKSGSSKDKDEDKDMDDDNKERDGLKLCRMLRLSVSKAHRGKGYGKQIIRHLTGVARDRGFDRILVETETLWASAVQIYKSLGFRVVEAGEENVHFEYDL